MGFFGTNGRLSLFDSSIGRLSERTDVCSYSICRVDISVATMRCSPVYLWVHLKEGTSSLKSVSDLFVRCIDVQRCVLPTSIACRGTTLDYNGMGI